MILGTDASNKVWMVSDASDSAAMPAEFNGIALTAHVLTPEQEVLFLALPSDRTGTIFDGTTFSAILATPSAVPNVQGFVNGLKAAMGGIVGANLLMRAYPAFYDALAIAQWTDVQALIEDAKTTGVINATQYATFQQLVTQFNIPVSLP